MEKGILLQVLAALLAFGTAAVLSVLLDRLHPWLGLGIAAALLGGALIVQLRILKPRTHLRQLAESAMSGIEKLMEGDPQMMTMHLTPEELEQSRREHEAWMDLIARVSRMDPDLGLHFPGDPRPRVPWWKRLLKIPLSAEEMAPRR